MKEFVSIYGLALIPLAWCGLSLLMARLSGWTRLAKQYRCSRSTFDQAEGVETARMRSGRIGVVNYPQCLMFRIGEDGLRIAVAFPLRLGHPPLLIPWGDLHHVEAEPKLYSYRVRLSIGSPTLVRAILPGWVRYRLPLEIRP